MLASSSQKLLDGSRLDHAISQVEKENFDAMGDADDLAIGEDDPDDDGEGDDRGSR
jgi:hypothetical protein